MPMFDRMTEPSACKQMLDGSYDLNENLGPIGGGTVNSEARFSDMVEPVTGNLVNIKAQKSQSILSRFMLDRHKRAAKTLGYVLTLAEPMKWAATARIWEARLNPTERYELARSVMLAMQPEDIEAVIADVTGAAGYPLPSFLDPLADAQWWAGLANPAELRAYCLAAFMSMTKREQGAFLDFANGGSA